VTHAATVVVRPFAPSDIAPLLAINEAAVPGVNSLDRSELERLISLSAATLVAADSKAAEAEPLGFVLCLHDGLDYESLNYAWLSERYAQFSYVDRVAVSDAARGRGVGRALYEAAFAQLAQSRDVLLCEVNLEPPNPQSQAFHASLGFHEIGERWLSDRSKGVVYLAKPLAP